MRVALPWLSRRFKIRRLRMSLLRALSAGNACHTFRLRQMLVLLRRWNFSGIARIMDASKCCQRAVAQFLKVENMSAGEIYGYMQYVYGTECMSRRSEFRWCWDFRTGWSSMDDRALPVKAYVGTTKQAIAVVDNLVKNYKS